MELFAIGYESPFGVMRFGTGTSGKKHDGLRIPMRGYEGVPDAFLPHSLAVVQRLPNTRVVVFYDKEQAHRLARLTERFPLVTLAFPIAEDALEQALR